MKKDKKNKIFKGAMELKLQQNKAQVLIFFGGEDTVSQSS